MLDSLEDIYHLWKFVAPLIRFCTAPTRHGGSRCVLASESLLDTEPLIANRKPGALEDAVRPNRNETQSVLERSHDVWSSCAQNADSELRLPLEYIQLQSMLSKVPSFPTALINDDGKVLDLKLEHWESRNNASLFMSGVSTWETSAG